MSTFFRVLLSLAAITLPNFARATHLYGADLFYTHFWGNIYTITLVAYGDCSGTPAAVSGLYSATPEIEIYNNGSFIQALYLIPTNTGLEVTPVCPAQINNTTCNGGTVPGVRRFIYSANVTLPPSDNWLFRFTGQFMNNTLAGRSNTLTNIVSGSLMNLEATLNNSIGPNSSPTYTTIPTPFFCINKPAQFNPGALDPDADGLVFSLVSGLEVGGVPIAYLPSFTPAQPIAVTPSSLFFSGITGQLDFFPNLAQNALVVGKVEEYRNGVLVGTSMREMTFVVLNSCNNNPPGGTITNPIGGTVVNNTTLRVCNGQSSISFTINPSDLDGDIINVTTAGVPAGANLNIFGNNTANPFISFSWNLTGVQPGAYTFFVTYIDNGCPLSSKQTVAYTISITNPPSYSFTLAQAATCAQKAVFHITPTGQAPFSLSAYQGATLVHTINNIASPQADSLPPGIFTIRVIDVNGCLKDSTVSFSAPPPVFSDFTTVDPTCATSPDGTITAMPFGGTPPYQYAIDNGAFGANPVFNGLTAGPHTLRVRDLNHCQKDTTVILQGPPDIIPSAMVKKSLCADVSDGEIILAASNGVAPYQYALGNGAYTTSPIFGPLAAGSHVFHIKDNNNCVKDTTITLEDSIIVTATVTVTNVLCTDDVNGGLTVLPSGGSQPYLFALGTAAFGASNTFSSLGAGTYVVHVRDANGCTGATSVQISQPAPLASMVTITPPSCFGSDDGTLSVTGSGGTPGYTYAIDAGPFSPAAVFSGLASGSYTIHIRDSNNCLHDRLVQMDQPSPLQIAVSVSDLRCPDDQSGHISVLASGGTLPYAYAANGGAFQTSSLLATLNAGLHLVQVRDDHGCQKDTLVEVSEPLPVVFNEIAVTHPTCDGFADGRVFVSGAGGTGPYTYAMNSGAFSPTVSYHNLPEGSYTFSVMDAQGCRSDSLVELTGYPDIIIDELVITPASCFGAGDGMVTVLASGGNLPLSFSVDGGSLQMSNTLTGLESAEHRLRIQDATGCKADSSFFVSAPQVLQITPVVTNNDCIGLDDNGMIKAVVAGGTEPYSFTWSRMPEQSGQTAMHLANGLYTVSVRDAKGCTDTASAEVVYDDCCNVLVPSGFTPNNDGRNDKLRILYKGDMQLLQISIYNRFGQRVFYSVNIDQQWDGTFNGTPQEVGTYFYYMQVICGNKRSGIKEYRGDVLLIR